MVNGKEVVLYKPKGSNVVYYDKKKHGKRMYNGGKAAITTTPISDLGSSIGNGIAYVGSLGTNTKAGRKASKGMGNFIGWIMGTGDYRTNFQSSGVPSFAKSESTVITHREYIKDIFSGVGSPSAFNIEKFPLNPGLSTTFPWLSAIASNYEEYELQGCVFEFKSNSGESVSSANTALGSVIMATMYDPTKLGFDTKQGMENYSFAQACKPSVSMLHAVELKKSLSPMKQLYVRGSGVDPNEDLRWTDFGNFFIATVGQQTTGVNLGELWVTYKVKLLKPRLPTTVGASGFIPGSFVTGAVSTLANALFVAAPVPRGTLNLVTIPTGNTISFDINPSSYYILTVVISSGFAATGPILLNSTTNLIPFPNYYGASDFYNGPTGTATGPAILSAAFKTAPSVQGGLARASTIIIAPYLSGSALVTSVYVQQVDDSWFQQV